MTYLKCEKHEIQMTCSNEKAWIDDCVLKMQNLCEKAYETQMNKGSSIRSKHFIILMSIFLYWLNMSTIIRISYPKKSSRVQSRSWHGWLIKLDIVVLNLKSWKPISLLIPWHWWNWFEFILVTFVICFAKYHGILDLNATCLVCKASLIHTFSF